MIKPYTYNLSSIPGFDELIKNNNDSESNILKLNKIQCTTLNKQNYGVIRYDKNILTPELIHNFGLCRSIVINSTNDVVSFAPPKSLPLDVFINKYPNKTTNLLAQEFIEGTMINVFWDKNIGQNGDWEISTRNIVGATSSFYKNYPNKSFRDMFFEACIYNNVILNNLNKANCYSFVLQHPNNRIVIPFSHPQLYLVAVYTISKINKHIGDEIIVHSHNIEEIKKEPYWSYTTIKFPETIEWNNYDDLKNQYDSMNNPYDILGVVIHNLDSGERTKIRNPVYEQVRHLRGNQPKLQYQYLYLRNQGRVSEFLKFFPENKHMFAIYRDQVHLFTTTLYNNYISCYIKKERPLIEFPQQYRTHMYNLHQKYLNQLKNNKLHITNTEVIRYVNELHPSILMYSLNYHHRKRNIDFVKSDSKL